MHAASRRPWSVEEQSACFIVRDRGGGQIGGVDVPFATSSRHAPALLDHNPKAMPGRKRRFLGGFG
jgi:hypothetical protein